MDIGVREFKEHLSEYLERAAAGEVLRITDRGHPKAVLGPVPGRHLIDAGVAEKWIRPAKQVSPRRVQRHRAKDLTTTFLLEDRGT